jgi:putative SOS response-associated peptidase YedK
MIVLMWVAHEHKWFSTPYNRMPAILEPAAEQVWLDPNVTDAQELTSLLHPYTTRPLNFYPVSKAVNRAGFDAPQLIQQVAAGA